MSNSEQSAAYKQVETISISHPGGRVNRGTGKLFLTLSKRAWCCQQLDLVEVDDVTPVFVNRIEQKLLLHAHTEAFLVNAQDLTRAFGSGSETARSLLRRKTANRSGRLAEVRIVDYRKPMPLRERLRF